MTQTAHAGPDLMTRPEPTRPEPTRTEPTRPEPARPEPARPEVSLQADLQRARTALVEAELSHHPGDRYLAAHLAALRVAAIVLALRARPGRGSSRPRNAWLVLAEVAPELGEWAAFFAATSGKREAVRAGATAIITAREADDLVRDAQTFFGLVERALSRDGRLRG
jgi:hypothetical protein